MADTSRTRLRWSGSRTVEEARRMISQGNSIDLELPADLHHAVFVHVHPDADPGRHEHVDAKGGAELIERIAEIASLGELENLTDAVSSSGATVHVTSPTPRITITVSGRPTA